MASPPNSEVTPTALELARHSYYHLRDILDQYAEAYHQIEESYSAEADARYSHAMALSVMTLLTYIHKWDENKWAAMRAVAQQRAQEGNGEESPEIDLEGDNDA